MKRNSFTLRLEYNSPVILTFSLLCVLVLLLDSWTDGWTTGHLFCVYRSSMKDPLFYIRLVGHVLGHADWNHFMGNILLLLVIGPPMEKSTAAKTCSVRSCSRPLCPACCNACCSPTVPCWGPPASCLC